MECTSFLPGCYSSSGLNVGANVGTWALYNNEKTLNSGHSRNGFLTLPTKDQPLVYEKELLRQKILKHESIFRDQVRELHQLYRRQRELMDEITRRELPKQNLQLQTSQRTWQNPGLPWVNPAASGLSISSAQNFHLTSSFSERKSTQENPHSKLSLSQCEKPKRKILDLELPPEEYVDSEEEDRSAEEMISKVPDVPYYPTKRVEEISRKSDLEPIPCGLLKNSICPGGSSTRTNDLTDLNQPIWLEDAIASTSVNFLGSTHRKVRPHNDETGPSMSNLNSPPQVPSSEKLSTPFEMLKSDLPAAYSTFRLLDKCDGKTQKQGSNSAREIAERNDFSNKDYQELPSYGLPTSYQLVPRTDLAISEPSTISSQRKTTRIIRQNPIAVQALPCFKVSVPSSKSIRSKATTPSLVGNRNANSTNAVDLNLPPSCLLDSEVSQEMVGGVNRHDDSRAVSPKHRVMPDCGNKLSEGKGDFSQTDLVFSQDFPKSVCYSEPKMFNLDIIGDSTIPGVRKQIDLNCCIKEDESSSVLSPPIVTIKSVAEIDLEAPVSPENKECSPPRGESEENQLAITPIKNLSKQEVDRDQKDEVVGMAAETIVLISTSRFQKLLLDNASCEKFESLHWFAGIVSSMAYDLENEVSWDGSDYFESMTLELTETNVEQYRCNNHGRKENEMEEVLSSSQLRRGRAMRGRQRKNFQMEVLPSLASLSRHEVTEDLQTIGGLMEAAGVSVETSLGRRNVGRNACSRARRRSGNSFCHGTENTVCSTLKQRTTNEGFGFGEKSLKGWGKINRRRRGPRIAASNPKLIFS